jgi:hypothetical protein
LREIYLKSVCVPLLLQGGAHLVYGWGDRCDFQDLLEAIDGEVADTDTPVKTRYIAEGASEGIRVRGKSIPLSLLKILPDRGDIPPREVDEIHIQLPQSQLEERQLVVGQRSGEILYLVQTYCDGFTHI